MGKLRRTNVAFPPQRQQSRRRKDNHPDRMLMSGPFENPKGARECAWHCRV